MKTNRLLIIILMVTLGCGKFYGQNITITDNQTHTADTTAVLDIFSESKGLLIPRLTTTQRSDINNPSNGLLVYDINLNSFYYYKSDQWLPVSGMELWKSNGDSVYIAGDGLKVGIGTTEPVGRFSIQGDSTASTSDPLFEVRNSEGLSIFAVYEDHVDVNFIETGKGVKGGFAVGGLTPGKSSSTEYLRITPDSVRIYINDTLGKGVKGGFAVGGLTPGKTVAQEYLKVTPDSARVYVKKTAKGVKGGFAVGGLTPGKATGDEILHVSEDSVRIYIDNSGTKGVKGGFAVGGLTPGKAGDENYFNITADTTAEIVQNESRIMWYPKKSAFLAGEIHVGAADSVGTNSTALGYRNIAKGNYSQAMGYQSQALGLNSTAMGNQALASDTNSFAFGNNAQANGLNSFAFGDSAIAENQDSYAFGAFSYASGLGAFSIGSKDRNSHDAIYSTLATGDFSFAVGFDAEATNEEAVAIGNGVKAYGYNSVAIGRGAQANADYATAISYGMAYGEQSIAMGSGRTTGQSSLAHGLSALAEGDYSIALGEGSHATGENSIALGGYYSYATGQEAVSIGVRTTAQSRNSFVIGRWNIVEGDTTTWEDTDPLFAIGNGASSFDRSNAVTVYKNGNMEVDGYFYPTEDNTYDIGNITHRWDDIYATNGVIQTSDKRLKKDIKNIQYGLHEIMQLRPVSFLWNDKPEKGLKLGLIAQEVQTIIKEAVYVGDDEKHSLGINYSDFVPVLIKGIQEQEAKILKLEKENKSLKSTISDFESRLKELENKIKK